MRLTETFTFTTFDAEPITVISSRPCNTRLASGSVPVHTDLNPCNAACPRSTLPCVKDAPPANLSHHRLELTTEDPAHCDINQTSNTDHSLS